MSVFACVMFWERIGGLGGGQRGLLEVNKDLQFHWGAINPNLINLTTLILRSLLLSSFVVE